MLELSTSYRETDPSKSLFNAIEFGKLLGIVRVAEVTRLDRIGVPVFASIRPGAKKNSLCVHAGKGLTSKEAKASALMEAIEFAVVESPRSNIDVFETSAEKLFGKEYAEKLIEYCPIYGIPIPTHKPLRWVLLEELYHGSQFPVPADLVLFPLPEKEDYVSYFGASTNGLASGNSVAEATIHALLEVIERDIESFRLVKDNSYLLDNESLPNNIKEILIRAKCEGLSLICRAVPNLFSIPYFVAYFLESDSSAAVYASDGFGCHPNPIIALTRAVTEAAQSRLSHIHGGRDDIVGRYNLFAKQSKSVEMAFNEKFRSHVTNGQIVSFESITPLKVQLTSSIDILNCLLTFLQKLGFRQVGRKILSHPDDPIAVVRVLIPKLECLNSVNYRVGKRLAQHVKLNLT